MTKDADSPLRHERETSQQEEYSSLDPTLRARVKANSQPGPFGLKTKVVWTNVYYMAVLHVLAVYGAVIGALEAKWPSLLMNVMLVMCSLIGITAGAHRLWTHRSYKATLPLRIVFMCFNSMAMQNSIFVWTRDHRLHHKFTETDADPHNAKRGFFFAHIGWLLMRKHPQVLIKGRHIDVSDLKRDPVVMFQHRHSHKLSLLFNIFLPVSIPLLCWGESIAVSFLFLFVFRYIFSLHCTWLVNSAAHLWGHRPYDKQLMPAENYFVCYAALGEGYHNYHHSFPYDYATGEWGPKVNITTCFIDICAAFGLVYDRRQVSQEAIQKIRQRKGDLAD